MATKKAASQESAENTYQAQEGDSWWSIAKEQRVPINDLLALNDKKTISAPINAGDSIKLPGSAAEPAPEPVPAEPPEPPQAALNETK